MSQPYRIPRIESRTSEEHKQLQIVECEKFSKCKPKGSYAEPGISRWPFYGSCTGKKQP